MEIIPQSTSSPAPSRPLIWRLLESYCKDHDLALNAADALGHAGWIETSQGRRSFFSGASFDLNPLGAAQIARDKAHTLEVLARAGLPVPASQLLHSASAIAAMSRVHALCSDILTGPDEALKFAERIGYPVYVKPNDGQEGHDIHRALDPQGLTACFDSLFFHHDKLLIQEEIKGRDLRIIVLDGEILCALERHRPSITGDGHSTVAELLKSQPDKVRMDSRLFHELAAQNLTYCAVPEAGTTVTLLPVANLSAGGKGGLLEDTLPPVLADAAIACGQKLGLRYYGLDLLLESDAASETAFKILELNASPGLSQLHRQGGEAAGLALQIYTKVFDALRQDLEGPRRS
ncbi:ATP-grasp domain-containing protein [Roseibium litorale]|uniref:ATP-dependent carboxylate-amine ligase n=1 Tax=Roseibium litorale TaxID=2803841 RepID=A0ABR9CMW0_9HYPH|nr:ATP-dependent carboxylate-amine ligase [Roseibium litorale]MBD8892172.1 ATP-dependent carboxylate-amine ligase [Roseibium litorale]